MVLNVKGGQCDDPVRPTKCDVGFGNPFHIGVHALGIPANGYVGIQTFIDYGSDLVYKDSGTLTNEILWPDALDSFIFIGEPGPGLLFHGAITSVLGDVQSIYVGKLVSVSMTCPDASTVTTVDLLPFDDPVAGASGSRFREFGTLDTIIPKVGSLTINCIVAPTPGPCPTGGCATPTLKFPHTPTPTITLTPTITPTPKVPPKPDCRPGCPPEMVLNVKGGRCDDPARPTKCDVAFGNPFHIGVHALGIPASGYYVIQTFIDYGGDLIYKPAETLRDEIVWPDALDAFSYVVEPGPGLLAHGAITSPFDYVQSTYVGKLVAVSMNCPDASTVTTVDLLPYGDAVAGNAGSMFREYDTWDKITPLVGSLTINCVVTITPTVTPTPTKQPFKGDSDADGCPDGDEVGEDERFGGLRDPLNPWDWYDVNQDGVIDLFGDIIGVIQHFSLDGLGNYDIAFDRGPSSGPNPWNMTAPDGQINLFTDILGVIQQFTLEGCT